MTNPAVATTNWSSLNSEEWSAALGDLLWHDDPGDAGLCLDHTVDAGQKWTPLLKSCMRTVVKEIITAEYYKGKSAQVVWGETQEAFDVRACKDAVAEVKTRTGVKKDLILRDSILAEEQLSLAIKSLWPQAKSSAKETMPDRVRKTLEQSTRRTERNTPTGFAADPDDGKWWNKRVGESKRVVKGNNEERLPDPPDRRKVKEDVDKDVVMYGGDEHRLESDEEEPVSSDSDSSDSDSSDIDPSDPDKNRKKAKKDLRLPNSGQAKERLNLAIKTLWTRVKSYAKTTLPITVCKALDWNGADARLIKVDPKARKQGRNDNHNDDDEDDDEDSFAQDRRNNKQLVVGENGHHARQAYSSAAVPRHALGEPTLQLFRRPDGKFYTEDGILYEPYDGRTLALREIVARANRALDGPRHHEHDQTIAPSLSPFYANFFDGKALRTREGEVDNTPGQRLSKRRRDEDLDGGMDEKQPEKRVRRSGHVAEGSGGEDVLESHEEEQNMTQAAQSGHRSPGASPPGASDSDSSDSASSDSSREKEGAEESMSNTKPYRSAFPGSEDDTGDDSEIKYSTSDRLDKSEPVTAVTGGNGNKDPGYDSDEEAANIGMGPNISDDPAIGDLPSDLLGDDDCKLSHFTEDTLEWMNEIFGREFPTDPDFKVGGLPFKEGQEPKLSQLAGTMWQLERESQLIQYTTDGPGGRQGTQPVGTVIAHVMGVGKTLTSFLLFAWHAILRACAKEIERSRTSDGKTNCPAHCGLSDPKGTICPSSSGTGLWRNLIKCPCQPGSPTSHWILNTYAGATLQVVRPHLMFQWLAEFDKFVDVHAFRVLTGIEPVCAVAYEVTQTYLDGLNSKTVRKFEDVGRPKNGTGEAMYDPFSPPLTLEDWSQANPHKPKAEVEKAILLQEGEDRGLIAPVVPESKDDPSALFLVSTPGCLLRRVVDKNRIIFEPAASSILGLEEKSNKVCWRSEEGGKLGYCWSSACKPESTTKQHSTKPLRTKGVTYEQSLRVRRVFLDEVHEYWTDHGVFTALKEFTTKQRHRTGDGAMVTLMSGTLNNQSPFDSDDFILTQAAPTWEEHEFLRYFTKATAETGRSFFKCYAEAQATQTCTQKVFKDMQKHCLALNMSDSEVPFPDEGPKDDFERLEQIRDYFRKNVTPGLRARMEGMTIRFDKTTEWLGKRLINRPPVTRKYGYCSAICIPEHLKVQFDELAAMYEAAGEAIVEIQARQAARRGKKNETVDRETNSKELSALAKSRGTRRDFEMVRVCPLLLELVHEGSGKPSLLTSKGLKERGVFTNADTHPFRTRGEEIYKCGGKIADACHQVAKYWSDPESGRRSVGHVDHPSPITISVYEVGLWYCIRPAMLWFLNESATHDAYLLEKRKELGGFRLECCVPGSSAETRSKIVFDFCAKPVPDSDGKIVPDKKVKLPVDLLCLPARTGITGLNLTECNFLINVDIIPRMHNQEQLEGRFDRPGQARQVTVLQLLENGSRTGKSTKIATLDDRHLTRRERHANALIEASKTDEGAVGGQAVGDKADGGEAAGE
jgi:hypothetical protein